MHIERHFLCARRWVLVAETVNIFAISVRIKRVVARRDSSFENCEAVGGILDLFYTAEISISNLSSTKKWGSAVEMRMIAHRCRTLTKRVASGKPPCRQWNESAAIRTQKSTSKFPAPPNSRSPTWKVTVILSSLCSCSWKHSRECAPRTMLCPRLTPSMLARATHE